FKPAAEQRNLSFQLDLPKMHLQAFVDAEAFKKILTNLLSNAVKYARSEVHIGIMPFSSEDDSFSIKISNDGYVIGEDMKEKIFEPFFRLKETEKQPGTGIGLALSRSLAQLHNGSLACEPKNDLNVFVLTLPVHHEKEFQFFNGHTENADTLLRVGQQGPDEAINKQTILVVEDNKEILDFIATELKRTYHILKAFNGSEAIALLQKEAVQLVISDVMMPVMDGLELCKRIKSNFEFSHIPIILLTAKNTLQSKIEGLEMGADAYIEKPFAQQHLEAQINSLITNRNKVKDYFATSPLVHIKSMAYSRADENFLLRLNDVIHEHLSDTTFNVEHLAKILNMSRPTLYRKIKALSNLTPNELINVTRLKRGATLLAEGNHKIYEVAELLGYSLHANFSRDFMKQFNMSPTDYIVSKRTGQKTS
ncbi:MAG: response regulator, partial [Chitinophagaceae bacterium]|nr:response regulator [Chitinophagaceae bacterium]